MDKEKEVTKSVIERALDKILYKKEYEKPEKDKGKDCKVRYK